jgi:hypothetical protein
MQVRISHILLACIIALVALINVLYFSNHREEIAESEKIVLLSQAAKQRLKEAVDKAGRGPSPAERAKLRHVMMPIANHLATRFDWLRCPRTFLLFFSRVHVR